MSYRTYNHYTVPLQNKLRYRAIERKLVSVVDNSPTSAYPSYATQVLSNEGTAGYLSTSMNCNAAMNDTTTCMPSIRPMDCGKFEPLPKPRVAGEVGELVVKRSLDMIL